MFEIQLIAFWLNSTFVRSTQQKGERSKPAKAAFILLILNNGSKGTTAKCNLDFAVFTPSAQNWLIFFWNRYKPAKAALILLIWAMVAKELLRSTIHVSLKCSVCIFFAPFFSAVYDQERLILQKIYVLNKEMWA